MRDAFMKLVLRGDGGPLRTELEKSVRHTRDSGRRMQQGMAPADQQMQRVAATARRLTGILAGLAGAASMGALIRSQINAADAASKMAQRTGESTETISTLGFAAEQSGSSIEGVGRAYDGFIRRLDQFRDGASKAGRAAQALGLDIFDAEGKVRPFSEILLDAADRLSMVEDPALKAQLATDMFGRSAGDLIPLLNQGSAGIQELQERARRYGREIDGDTGRAAEKFNDTMNELRGAAGGAARGFISQLLPSLLVISEQLRDSAADADGLASKLGQAANEGIKLLALGVRTAIVPLEAMGEAIGGGIAYVEQLARGNRDGARAIKEHMQATSAFEGPLQNLMSFYDDLYNAQDKYTEALEDGADAEDKAADAANRRAELNERLKAMFAEGDEAGQKSAEKRAEAEAKAIADMQRQIDTLGDLSREEMVLYEIRAGNYAQFSEQTQRRLVDLARELDAAEALIAAERARMAEQERLATEAQRIYQATRTPAEQLANEIDRLNGLLDAGALDWDTYARAVFDAQEKFEGTAEEAVKASEFAIQGARNIQSAFADFLFDPFEKGLRGMLAGFVDVIRRMAAEALAAQLAQTIFGNFGTGQMGGLVGGVMASVFHQGGVAGGAAPSRQVPLSAFVGAPRYHNGGLAGDEVAAVLQRGEEVITKDDPRHRSNMGGRMEVDIGLSEGLVVQAMRSRDVEQAILRVISRNRGAVLQEIG